MRSRLARITHHLVATLSLVLTSSCAPRPPPPTIVVHIGRDAFSAPVLAGRASFSNVEESGRDHSGKPFRQGVEYTLGVVQQDGSWEGRDLCVQVSWVERTVLDETETDGEDLLIWSQRSVKLQADRCALGNRRALNAGDPFTIAIELLQP